MFLINPYSYVTPAPAGNAFTFSVDTTKAGTASNQFTLPLVSAGTISMDVAWGDGTTNTITSYSQAEKLHTYSASGIYTVEITNEVRGFRFGGSGDFRKILDISNWGEFNFTESNVFYNCSNLTSSATDLPTISTTNMQWTFASTPLFNGDISGWDMSNVTSLFAMFYQATSFNQNLGAWDIDQITNMQHFMAMVTSLSTANYDALLIGWEAQAPNGYQQPNFGGSTYTLGSPAATARASLVSTYHWTITDGGGI